MSKTNPAAMLSEASQALAEERRLNVFLDQIIAAEKVRNEASDVIRELWSEVRKAGFPVDEARRKLVRRAINPVG